ncbi:MAG: hypothetical protein CL843_03190 [Crocinitomicaceae bacterium]|nr:hypothetical protein [Crocinitomicaceae bacterium]
MSKPKLSVIIPVYNLGTYIDECLSSFNTEREDIEVLLLDDGSTDQATIEKLKSLESSGYNVIWQENAGVCAARNSLIRQAQADYILPVDPDNKISDEYITKGIQILDENPEVGVVFSDVRHFGEQVGDVRFDGFDPVKLLSVNYIDNCAVFRKTIWEKANGYDVDIPFLGYEDWDMWIEALDQGWKFHHIPELLFQYRNREGSLVKGARSAENHVVNYRYIIEKHPDLFQKNNREVLIHLGRQVAELIEKQSNFDGELRAALKDKDVHIDNLEKAIQQKDERIKNIDQAVHEKDNTIKTISLAISDKDVHIQNIDDQLKLYVKQLDHAMKSIGKLEKHIKDLESNILYRFLKEIKNLAIKFRSNSNLGSSKNLFKKIIVLTSKKSLQVARRFLAKITKHIYLALEETRVVIVEAGQTTFGLSSDPYMNWIEMHRPKEDDILRQRIDAGKFEHAPFFSIVMPVYNPPIEYFKKAIDSVMHQSYENWELILSDDCSSDPNVQQVIKSYQKKDPRIKAVFRKENGHISKASNSGLEIAEGDFIVLMDQDDLITADALYKVAKVIEDTPDTDLIYTDEDKIDEDGHHSYPHFKPDWSPENLLSRNYLGHLTVFRASIMKAIGGWRVGFEGSQDYDLVLRFTEETDRIKHIPEVLYHWRVHEQSAASNEEAKPYAYIAAQKALTEALQRRKMPGTVDFLDGFRGYSIRLDLAKPAQKVSIIIPTKDKADVLEVCLQSIFEKTTYSNYEVLVVDNNSEEKETFKLFDEYQQKHPENFKVERTEEPFNFSFLMNFGRKHVSGEYLVLLNNDTEVISTDWLEGFVEQAQRDEIGVVGCKLLYPNNTIQHAGVIMGLGGAAGHVFVGEHRDGPGYFNYINLLNNYSALTAACFMIRTEVFDKVNGFDERYQVEYNDVDFCLRVLEAGYRNLYVPHVELYHHESISRGHPHLTKASLERHKRELGLLRTQWENYIENDPHYNPNLSLGAHDFRMKH